MWHAKRGLPCSNILMVWNWCRTTGWTVKWWFCLMDKLQCVYASCYIQEGSPCRSLTIKESTLELKSCVAFNLQGLLLDCRFNWEISGGLLCPLYLTVPAGLADEPRALFMLTQSHNQGKPQLDFRVLLSLGSTRWPGGEWAKQLTAQSSSAHLSAQADIGPAFLDVILIGSGNNTFFILPKWNLLLKAIARAAASKGDWECCCWNVGNRRQ